MIEVLDGKLKEYKEQLSAEVKAANAKADEVTLEVNEKMQNQGASLLEIKEALTELQKKSGRIAGNIAPEVKNFETEFVKAIEEKAADLARVNKSNPVELKLDGVNFDTKTVGDMTVAANLTGSAVAGYSLDPALRGRRKVNFRDIPGVGIVNSATGTWKFYRNNSAVGEGSFGVQSIGSAKAQIDYDFTEVTITLDTIAGFSRIAKQMMRDLPFMQSFLPAELREDYFRAETNKFINVLMPQIAAYSTSASVYAEKLVEWASVIAGRDYDATAFVTSAANWATLLNTKPSDYSIPGATTIDAMGRVMVAGIPVVVCNGITGTKTLTGDFSRLKVVQGSGLSVQFFEQDADNVTKNLVTVRAEADVALAALRTDAFIYE